MNFTFSRPFEVFSNVLMYGFQKEEDHGSKSLDVFNKLNRIISVHILNDDGAFLHKYDLFPGLTTTISHDGNELWIHDSENKYLIPKKGNTGRMCITDNDNSITGNIVYRFVVNQTIKSSNIMYLRSPSGNTSDPSTLAGFIITKGSDNEPNLISPMACIILVLFILTVILTVLVSMYIYNVLRIRPHSTTELHLN